MTIQIRNSDISEFKRCREAWNFSSGHKLNLRPNKSPVHFGFGTSVHRGCEVLYNPTDIYNTAKAVDAFVEAWSGYMQDCFDPQEWADMKNFGIGMLEGYADYAIKNDDFLPVRNEVEFEVPIIVPKGMEEHLPVGFTMGPSRHLFYKGEAVVFAGRIDLLGRNQYGYVVVDHKTAKQFHSLEFLEMDEQLSKYGYAMTALGFKVVAIYYNQLGKAIPCGPTVLRRELKSGKTKVSLSKNKAELGVTAEAYKLAVAEHGLNMADYAEHVQWLEANPPDLFRRTVVTKTNAEYVVIEKRLFFEAIDMLNNPNIYPSPNSNWGCTNCLYREPCIAKNEGNAINMILRNGYHVRGDDE